MLLLQLLAGWLVVAAVTAVFVSLLFRGAAAGDGRDSFPIE